MTKLETQVINHEDTYQNLATPMAIIARDGTVKWANQQALSDYGATSTELIGKKIAEILSESSVTNFFPILRKIVIAEKLLRTHNPTEKIDMPEAEVVTLKGRKRILRIKPKFIQKEDSSSIKSVEGAVLEIEDITRLKQTEALAQTAILLSGSLDPEKVINIMQEVLKKVIPFDTANIMLIENTNDYPPRIHFSHTWGYKEKNVPPPADTASITFEKYKTLQEMYDTQRSIFIPDTSKDDRWVTDGETRAWVQSYAGAPIIYDGKVIGFLNLNNSKIDFYDNKDIKILQAFAVHFGQALNNAKLHEATQLLAKLDSLTGINNHANLMADGQRAIKFSEREKNQPFGVAMLDIDHFKDVNDTHGHATGDAVLISLARALDNLTRFPSVIGRYGGEEFGLVMPLHDIHQAWLQLSRINEHIRSLKFNSGDSNFSITASIGIAVMDPLIDKHQVEEYFDRADTALYVVKQAEDRNGIGFHISRTKDTDQVIVFKPQPDNSTRIAIYDVRRTNNVKKEDQENKYKLVSEYYFTKDTSKITLRRKVKDNEFSSVTINLETEEYEPSDYYWSHFEMQIMQIINPSRIFMRK